MHKDAQRRNRRHFVQATGACALATAFGTGTAKAQPARRYAVVSLIGDELVVVYVGLQTGTLLDPNRTRTVADPNGTMDPLRPRCGRPCAGRRRRRRREPADAAPFAAARAGRALGAGQGRFAARPVDRRGQPEWGHPPDHADEAPRRRQHPVCWTPARAPASCTVWAFTWTPMRASAWPTPGATDTGMLATYAYVTLTLAEARTGTVLNQRHMAGAWPVSGGGQQDRDRPLGRVEASRKNLPAAGPAATRTDARNSAARRRLRRAANANADRIYGLSRSRPPHHLRGPNMNLRCTLAPPQSARRLTLIGLLLAAAPVSWAQTAMKSVGIFSLLGDSVQVAVSTDAPKDTRIERTERYAVEAKGIGFDNIALRALRDALQTAYPKAQVELYKAPTPLTPDEQRVVAEGAASAELPGLARPDYQRQTAQPHHPGHP